MFAFKLTMLLAIVLPEVNSITPECGSNCVPNETQEGEGVEFTCTAPSAGDGTPVLTWDLSPIGSDQPAVRVQEDDGTNVKRAFTWNVVAPLPLLVCYSSVVDSDGLFEKCETKQCDILYSPRNVKTSHDYFVSPGENITCTADGNPPPTFTWQQSDGYGTWTDVEGAKGETITAELKEGATYTELRCVAVNIVIDEIFVSAVMFMSTSGATTRNAIIIVVVIAVVVGVISGVVYAVKRRKD